MYRYIVDNAVTYTPEDLVLFRESPFAVWMERLTLENPDHGILPDLHGAAAADPEERQENIATTLRAEGRQVAAIDWDLDEAERRAATLAAMRDGADFIVDGRMAVEALSGSVNLLMRTSGYSELGDYLYIPCETKTRDSFHSAFRLSFAANLLHSLQGQLPPQMLIIRDGADVVPLQTEDHIYYYLAVQQRFLSAMQTFRKHRMPDPAESSHFGRWSECASEVLKQRTLREQYQAEERDAEEAEEAAEESLELPQVRVATGFANTPDQFDIDVAPRADATEAKAAGLAAQETAAANFSAPGHTLAEQAQMLESSHPRPGAAPGRTPNLARFSAPETAGPETPKQEPEPVNREEEPRQRSSNAMLENLEFIGSNGIQTIPMDAQPVFRAEQDSPAPAPNLRETVDEVLSLDIDLESSETPEQETEAPFFLPPDPAPAAQSTAPQPESRPLFSRKRELGSQSVVDPDSAPSPALAPELEAEDANSEEGVVRPDFEANRPESVKTKNQSDANRSGSVSIKSESDADSPVVPPFNDSLNTSQEFDD